MTEKLPNYVTDSTYNSQNLNFSNGEFSNIFTTVQKLTQNNSNNNNLFNSPIPSKIFYFLYDEKDHVFKKYDYYPYFDLDDRKITKHVNPKLLQIKLPPKEKKIIYISNFHYPEGTIAASSTLDNCILTDKMYECASLAIVDKSHNTQSLLHIFPGLTAEVNQKIIKYYLSYSDPKNLELSIVSGCSANSGITVGFIVQTLEEFVPYVDINFFNFPSRKSGIYPFNRAIFLHNGELFCCNDAECTPYGFKGDEETDKKAMSCKINPNNLIRNPLEIISFCVGN